MGVSYVGEGRVLPIATPPMIGEVGALPVIIHNQKSKQNDNSTIVIRHPMEG